MRLVKKMFSEILISSVLILFFDSFITAFLSFAIMYFFFTFFRVDVVFASLPVVAIFLFSFYKKLKLNRIIEIEKRYPELKEMLRTSKDYVEVQNPIALALHSEVLNKVDRVDVSTLLNSKRLFWKFFIISIMLFSTVFIASTGIHFFDVSNAISTSPFISKIGTAGKRFIDTTFNFDLKKNYSEDPDIAKLTDDELNVSLDVYNTELDITDISEPEKNDFGGEYPTDIGGSAQENYEDKIPEEHKETINDYFEKIKG